MPDQPNIDIRKPNRWKGYDYSLPGLYFITLCTEIRKNYLWQENIGNMPPVLLSEYGKILDHIIRNLDQFYPYVHVDVYCIMPDHVHILLRLLPENDNKQRTDVSGIVKKIKTYMTREIKKSIWQKSFYDRVIRNEKEYTAIAAYIRTNPAGWISDRCDITDIPPEYL